MKKNRDKELLIYRIADYITALVAWIAFFTFRKFVEDSTIDFQQLVNDRNFFIGALIIPVAWILLYTAFDKYKDIYRYSRLSVFFNTLIVSFIGCFVILFVLLLDDTVLRHISILKSFVVLFLIHFLITCLTRMILLTRASRRLKSGKVTFNTLIIGGENKALELYDEICTRSNKLGHNFIGFIDSNGRVENKLSQRIQNLGKLDQLDAIISSKHIEEVIIAIEENEHNKLQRILDVLDGKKNVMVKILPDMYDILLGTVKMNHVYGAALIEIDQELMPRWQWSVKRVIDVSVSILGIIALSPLYLFAAIKVRLSSEGPIFYKQERIGLNSQPFKIIKFRSMYIDAESAGPQLSSDHDPRITPWGRIMRKWRIDETPQFFNVLRGDMSLVGPRPERKFYIDQILEKAPYYRHLFKVRPGITSWGQVKYGYASNLDQMLQRLKFDILYIENMSLSLDLKIMFYTVLVLIKGKGK